MPKYYYAKIYYVEQCSCTFFVALKQPQKLILVAPHCSKITFWCSKNWSKLLNMSGITDRVIQAEVDELKTSSNSLQSLFNYYT